MFPFFFSTLLLSSWLTKEAYYAMTTTAITGGYNNNESNASNVRNHSQFPSETETQFINVFEEDPDANSNVLNELPISDALSTITTPSPEEEEDELSLFTSEEEPPSTTMTSEMENENCSQEGTCKNILKQPETTSTTVDSQSSSNETSFTASLETTKTTLMDTSSLVDTISPTLENHIPVESPKAKENLLNHNSSPQSDFKENISFSPIQSKKVSNVTKSIFSEFTTTFPSSSSSNAFDHSEYTDTTTLASYPAEPMEEQPGTPTTVYPTKPTTDFLSRIYLNATVTADDSGQSNDFGENFTSDPNDTDFSTEVSTVSGVNAIFLNYTKSSKITHQVIETFSEKTPTEKFTQAIRTVSMTSKTSVDKSSKVLDERVTSPQPKLTNPTCAMLPVCIKVRVVSDPPMCLPIYEEKILKVFRTSIADALSQYSRPTIHQTQIILELHPCSTTPPVALFFITDSSAEYEEVLTVLAGVLLKKLFNTMPPTNLPFQVIEVEILGMEGKAQEILAVTPPPLPTTHSGMVAAVAISAVAGACLCLLCVLLLVMKHRLATQQPQQCSQTINNYSLDSFSINASFRRRPAGGLRSSSFMNHAFIDDENDTASKPISPSALAALLQRKNLLEQEFQRIPMNMHKLDEVPPGAECKNRYANVVPNPQTRVQLLDKSDDPVKTYINANFVKGTGGRPKFYIACQAPLPEYTGDFWRMVWEQQSRLILMLTLLQENGVSRCTAYFPENTLDCRQLHGNYEVSLIKKDVREFYTASTLKLYDIEKKLFREVLHLWYKAWPSPDPSSLVAFIIQARPYMNCNPGPTIVHCSAGTGRTGVVLALDICMREYDASRSVDVLRCVSRIRMDRGGAVQNIEQYQLIHEALLEYVSLAANQSNRPSVCSNS